MAQQRQLMHWMKWIKQFFPYKRSKQKDIITNLKHSGRAKRKTILLERYASNTGSQLYFTDSAKEKNKDPSLKKL